MIVPRRSMKLSKAGCIWTIAFFATGFTWFLYLEPRIRFYQQSLLSTWETLPLEKTYTYIMIKKFLKGLLSDYILP